MKKFSKVLAASLALAMALASTACNTYDAKNIMQEHPEAKTAEDFIKISDENMAKVTSMDMAVSGEMIATIDGKQSTTLIDMTGSVSTDPVKVKMVMSVDVDGEKQTVETYAVQEEEEVMSYVTDGKTWVNTSTPASGYSVDTPAITPEQSLDLYKDNIDSFDIVGTDQMGGLNITILEGVLKGESIAQVLGLVDISGVSAQAGVSSEDAEAAAEMIDTMTEAFADAEIPMTIYVQDRMLYPVKYTMDLTQVTDAMVKAIAKAAADSEDEKVLEAAAALVGVDKYVITMTIKNFNNATEVVVPEAALKAAEAAKEASTDAEAAADTTAAEAGDTNATDTTADASAA